jgi:hypothetical protein
MIRKAEIDTALARLKDLSDDHFGCVATSIDWGDVGTLAHYAVNRRAKRTPFWSAPLGPDRVRLLF